jgi:two-component system, chemotaxis family, protein-glutamate methylesterase/glutaminase
MTAAHKSMEVEQSQKPISVIIVDDAVVVRGLLSRWLQESGGIEIIATYRNGVEAVAANRKPDVIILDIDMPEMDGMTALPLLIKKWPNASIIMASTLTVRNAEYTLRSLSLGAHDYIAKPATNRDVTFSTDFRREIIEKVQVLGRRIPRQTKAEISDGHIPYGHPASASYKESVPHPRPVSFPAVSKTETSVSQPSSISQNKNEGISSIPLRPMAANFPKLLMIGASTGGPKAVLELLDACRSAIRTVPVVIIQHMPAVFTQSFAENVSKRLSMDASEAQHGEPLEIGRIYVAPGGRHLKIDRSQSGNVIALDDMAPVNFFRPSVDVSFMSASMVYGASVLGVILTGMGTDGLQGSTGIVEKGGTILAQDEASSIVWGMPGSVARKGLCSAVAPVTELASIITRLTFGGVK